MVHASGKEVYRALDNDKQLKVRLIIVNDTKTAIIAGVPEDCQQLIQKLGCKASPMPQGMVGHCPEVLPHAEGIADIHDMLTCPHEEGIELFTQ